MSPVAAALVAEFEAAARTAQQAEEALRKKMAQEVAHLERQRAFAFRRTQLIRILAASAAAADSEAAAAADSAWPCARARLSGESEALARLDRLVPSARRVAVHGEKGDGTAAAVAPS